MILLITYKKKQIKKMVLILRAVKVNGLSMTDTELSEDN